MIGRDEIEAKAREFEINVANVERDYVFGWLLKFIYEDPYLSKLLILKGGNAFRKAFFAQTRFSSDLDFSTRTELDLARVQEAINQVCQRAEQACGVKFDIDRNRLDPDQAIDATRRSYKGRVYFRDFYGNAENITISVRLDITEFDRLYLDVEPRPLIHPYSDSDECRVELRCVALEELMANKLKCLLQRRHSHDLYDFVYGTFIDPPASLRRDAIVRVFLQKTIFEPSPGAAKGLLLGLPFTYFRGVWDKYIVCPVQSKIDFGAAETAFCSIIEELFAAFGSGRRESAFVPAHFRNPILEAGAAQKLIKLRYDGVVRDVEPYSLAYKRRKDGQAFEYFYGWDQTGGEKGPGIKAFLPDKIAAVEPTDVSFEPRYPIELSKAGEAASKGYFSGRGSFVSGGRAAGRSTTRGVSRTNPWKQTHRVECRVCGKQFERTTAGTSLRPHKDKSGWPCRGRVGYRVF